MEVDWKTIVRLTFCHCHSPASVLNLLCRFLYTLFLAADANFKLKGKDRSIHDPELAPGWASFVEEGRYQEHIAQYVDQPEVCLWLFGRDLLICREKLDQHLSIRTRCTHSSCSEMYIWV